MLSPKNICEEALPRVLVKSKHICRPTGINSNNLWPYYQNILEGPGRLKKSINAQLLTNNTMANKTPKLEFWTNTILMCEEEK